MKENVKTIESIFPQRWFLKWKAKTNLQNIIEDFDKVYCD